MPNKCCVIGCTYGRANDRPDVPGQETAIFTFPRDAVRSAEWLRKMKLPDLDIRPHTRICSRHFFPYFIKRCDKIVQPDGTARIEPCTPSYTYDALPSLLPPASNATDIKYPPQRRSLEEKYKRRPVISIPTPVAVSTGVQSLGELWNICAMKLASFSSDPQWIILPANPNADAQDYFTVVALRWLPHYGTPDFTVSAHISVNSPVRAFRGRTALALPGYYRVCATSWESVKGLLEFLKDFAITTELTEVHEAALLENAADTLELICQQADAKAAQGRSLTLNGNKTCDGDEGTYTGLPEDEDPQCTDDSGSTDTAIEGRCDDEEKNSHMDTTEAADTSMPDVGDNPENCTETGPASGSPYSQQIELTSEKVEWKAVGCRSAKEIASDATRRAHLQFLVEQLRCAAAGPHRLRFSEQTHAFAQALIRHSSTAYDMIRATGALILPHPRTLRRTAKGIGITPDTVGDQQFHLRKPYPVPVGERSHECSDCGKDFPSAGALRSHLNNNTQHKDVQAPETLISEANQEAIEHIKTTRTFSYYCRTCSRHYPSKAVFDLHQYHHLSEDSVQDTTDHIERTCPYCDYDGTSFPDLITHTLTHGLTGKDKKPCIICGRYSVIVRDHMRKCHRSLIKQISADWEHQCDECGDRFKRKNLLTLHRKLRHEGFQCVYCAKICYTALETGHHVLQHRTGDGSFPCPLCDKTYGVYPHLTAHYREHHDVTKADSCPICRSTVPGDKLDLANHVKRCGGRGEMDFAKIGLEGAKGHHLPCQECGELFVSKKALNDHLLLHTHLGSVIQEKQVREKRKREEMVEIDILPSISEC